MNKNLKKIMNHRNDLSILKNLSKQLILIILSIIIVMIFLFVAGYNPNSILIGFKRAMTSDIAGSIRWIAPLILAGIAVCIPFQAGVFNLGVDGQIYFGGIAATVVGLNIKTNNSFLGLFIIFLSAMLAGLLYAMLAAVLNIYIGTDLVVITLLLNYIASLFALFMSANVLMDQDAVVKMNASKLLEEKYWLPRLDFFGPTSANVGIYIAVILAVMIGFILKRTTLGYEIKIVGTNPNFAQYGGMNSKLVSLKVMAMSGAVAGIIGAIEVTAVQHRLIATFNPNMGFDGVVVSLLAGNNPFGVILSGAFFGILKNAGNNMERLTEAPQIITQIAMAIIILIISANIVIKKKSLTLWRRKNGNVL